MLVVRLMVRLVPLGSAFVSLQVRANTSEMQLPAGSCDVNFNRVVQHREATAYRAIMPLKDEENLESDKTD